MIRICETFQFAGEKKIMAKNTVIITLNVITSKRFELFISFILIGFTVCGLRISHLATSFFFVYYLILLSNILMGNIFVLRSFSFVQLNFL